MRYCPNCGKSNPDQSPRCEFCGADFSQFSNSPAAEKENGTIVNFLDRANQLEKAKFTLEQLCAGIEEKISQLGIPLTIRSPKTTEMTKIWSLIVKGIFWLVIPVSAIVILISNMSFPAFFKAVLRNDPHTIMGDVFLAVLLFSGISCFCKAAKAGADNGKARREYMQKVNDDNRRGAAEKDCVRELRAQEEIISDRYNKLEDQLQQLYGLNVIYGKYCNFSAAATMLEYFESGRCSGLKGPYGAYNLYEAELGRGIIIAKLDQVIDNLQSIQENQYVLYGAITEASGICERIEGQNESLIEESKSISSNSDLKVFFGQIDTLNNDTAAFVGQFQSL